MFRLFRSIRPVVRKGWKPHHLVQSGSSTSVHGVPARFQFLFVEVRPGVAESWVERWPTLGRFYGVGPAGFRGRDKAYLGALNSDWEVATPSAPLTLNEARATMGEFLAHFPTEEMARGLLLVDQLAFPECDSPDSVPLHTRQAHNNQFEFATWMATNYLRNAFFVTTNGFARDNFSTELKLAAPVLDPLRVSDFDATSFLQLIGLEGASWGDTYTVGASAEDWMNQQATQLRLQQSLDAWAKRRFPELVTTAVPPDEDRYIDTKELKQALSAATPKSRFRRRRRPGALQSYGFTSGAGTKVFLEFEYGNISQELHGCLRIPGGSWYHAAGIPLLGDGRATIKIGSTAAAEILVQNAFACAEAFLVEFLPLIEAEYSSQPAWMREIAS